MLIYIETFLLSLGLMWFVEHEAKLKKSRPWVKALIVTLPLVLLAGFRYEVGTDWGSYYRSYIYNNTGSFEWLYRFTCWLPTKLHLNVIWLFTICGFLFLIPTFVQVFRDSPNVYLSLFLLFGCRFYFAYLNIMRQLIGCGILMLSIPYIEKRDFKRFALIVAIASGYHSTCWVFLVAYWFCNLRFDYKSLAFILLMVATLGRVGVIPIINLILADTKYDTYLASGGAFDVHWLILAVQVAVIVLALVFPQKTKKFQIYFNLQILATWMASLSGAVTLAERLRHTFGLPSIIFLPMIISQTKNKTTKRVILTVIIVCYGYYGFRCLQTNGYYLIPYSDLITFEAHKSLFSYIFNIA